MILFLRPMRWIIRKRFHLNFQSVRVTVILFDFRKKTGPLRNSVKLYLVAIPSYEKVLWSIKEPSAI